MGAPGIGNAQLTGEDDAIARARGGDVEQAQRLGATASRARLMYAARGGGVQPARRSPFAVQAQPQPPPGAMPDGTGSGPLLGAASRHEHHRKLEALGLMHGHDAHHIVALVAHLGLRHLQLGAGRRGASEPCDKLSHVTSLTLEAASLLDEPLQVGYALLALAG